MVATDVVGVAPAFVESGGFVAIFVELSKDAESVQSVSDHWRMAIGLIDCFSCTGGGVIMIARVRVEVSPLIARATPKRETSASSVDCLPAKGWSPKEPLRGKALRGCCAR